MLQEHRTTKKSNFIVDSGNDSDGGGGDDDGDDYEDELFDYVCALCDNGGDLLAYAYNFLSFKLYLAVGFLDKIGFKNPQS